MEKPILKKKLSGGLGKGLASLLSDADMVNNKEENAKTSGIEEVAIEYIVANPFQPRTEFDETALNELADSIKLHGIIQPITLRKLAENEYQLIAGERRWRASKLAGLETVPAYVRTANDQQMLEMAIIENIQREDLNPIEVAISYQRLITECELRQEDLGTRVGKERSTVTNYLRLLKLPPAIQVGLRDKKLGMGHARAIISIADPILQLSAYEQIITEGLSVRKAEELARKLNTPIERNTSAVLPSPLTQDQLAMREVQQKLTSKLGTQVKINADANGKGEIKIVFHSVDDVNRILDLLGYQS
jgi:ParB family chromosome partitioning protein